MRDTYQDVLPASLRCILEIQPYHMLRQLPIDMLVDLVEHEIQ